MGWWKVEDTDSVIGDLPLDALGRAMREVLHEYQMEFDRHPTKSEWEALLTSVLGEEEPETRPLGSLVVVGVTLRTTSPSDEPE